MCASIFTLVAIASDRFYAIMFPLKSRITQRRVSLIMCIIWASSAAIGTPALFFYKYTERQWKDFRERFCSDVWPQTRDSDGDCDEGYMSKSTYWIFVLVVLNWFPMVIMLVVYTIILVRLGKKRIIPSSGALSSSAIQQRSKQKACLTKPHRFDTKECYTVVYIKFAYSLKDIVAHFSLQSLFYLSEVFTTYIKD